MTPSLPPPGRTERAAAYEAVALAQLRDNLRLTPAERLAVAEALLAFAIRTPRYTPKHDPALTTIDGTEPHETE